MTRPVYADLGDQDEDQQIETIARTVNALQPGKVVAVCTDQEEGKLQRYLEKLLAKIPGMDIVDIFDGPTLGIVTARIRRKE